MREAAILNIENGIADIRLNRPDRLNAINPDLLKGFADALKAAQSDPRVEVILLRGEGRAFCAGDDLKEFGQQRAGESETRQFIEDIQEVTDLIMNGDKIVVGAIHGWAVGGGLEWVMNCDIAIMAESCKCFFPEISLGLFVTGGVSTLLPNQVGLQKAKEMILLGEHITAQQALDYGIVCRVVSDDSLEQEARGLSEKIAALPRIARQNVKKVLNKSFQLPLNEAMELETNATVECFLDPEAMDRVTNKLNQ